MTTQIPKDGLDRTTLPDGKPSSEYTMKKGARHGIYRLWHENGVLAEEGRYRNGLLHGVIRKWNTKGQLLGTCKMDNGTGMLREWFENGQINYEQSFVQGKLTGRMKFWDRDGVLYGQKYFFDFRPISKKAYVQKCESMPELPQFEEEKTTNTLGNYMRQLRRAKREQAKSGPTPEGLQEQKWFDESCAREAKEKSSKELLAWLTKGNKQERENSASCPKSKLCSWLANCILWARSRSGRPTSNGMRMELNIRRGSSLHCPKHQGTKARFMSYVLTPHGRSWGAAVPPLGWERSA